MTEDEKKSAIEALIAANYMKKHALPVLQRAFSRGWAKGWENIPEFPQTGSLEEKSEFAWKSLFRAYPYRNRKVLEKILSWHVRDNFLPEDMPRLYRAFDKFDRKKHKLPPEQQDIGTYKTHRDFYAALKQLEPKPVELDFTWKEIQDRLPENALKTLWTSDDVALLHVRTKRAAQASGRKTEWCTSDDGEDNRFNEYKGNLLQVWTVQNNRVQIHFDSASWKNEDDEQIDLADFVGDYPGLDQALLPYLKKTFSKFLSSSLEGRADLIQICEKIPLWKEYLYQKGLPQILKEMKERITDDGVNDEEASAIFVLLKTLIPTETGIPHANIKETVLPELHHLKLSGNKALASAVEFYSSALKIPTWESELKDTLLPEILAMLKDTSFRKRERGAGEYDRNKLIDSLNAMLTGLYQAPSPYYDVGKRFINDIAESHIQADCDQKAVVNWAWNLIKPPHTLWGAEDQQTPSSYRNELIDKISQFLKFESYHVSDLLEVAFDHNCVLDSDAFVKSFTGIYDSDAKKAGSDIHLSPLRTKLLEYAKDAGYIDEMKPSLAKYLMPDGWFCTETMDYNSKVRLIDSLECPEWSAVVTETLPVILQRHEERGCGIL